jgi:hypothetical protein
MMTTNANTATAKGTGLVLKAAAFAAWKHRDQRRKDADASRYINHPLALAEVLASEGKVTMGSTSNLRRWLCSSVVRVSVISLLCLLAVPAPSITPAQPSRLLWIRVRDDNERVLLADLQRVATQVGMDCRPKPTTSYDGRPEPNPGIDCVVPPSDGTFRGNLSAVGLLAKRAVFLFILSSNVSSPHGEVDPIIEQVLLDFKQGFVASNVVQSFEECRAPDFDRCSAD